MDDMMVRVTRPGGSGHYKENEDDNDSDSSENREWDRSEEDESFSDGEELVPMKEPFEGLDDDDSVLEELERQYREQTDLFAEDNKCLTDVIMEQQGTELGGDRFEEAAAGDQTGWVSGRLTRQWIAEEQQVKREERAEKRIAREKEMEQCKG